MHHGVIRGRPSPHVRGPLLPGNTGHTPLHYVRSGNDYGKVGNRVQTLLVGIGHKARVGKDTCAWHLITSLRSSGIDARRYGFADALKAVCRVEYNMTTKDAVLLQQVGVRYRDGYRAGDEYRPSMDVPAPTPDIWVTTLLDTIAEDAPRVAVISDTRFRNEVAAIRAAGGLYLRIDRASRPATGRDDTHISEVDLDGVAPDIVIPNHGTLEELRYTMIETAWRIAVVDATAAVGMPAGGVMAKRRELRRL